MCHYYRLPGMVAALNRDSAERPANSTADHRPEVDDGTRSATGRANTSNCEGFTAEARGAMNDRAQEVKREARRSSRTDNAAEAERDVLAKIAELPDSDRVVAERAGRQGRPILPERGQVQGALRDARVQRTGEAGRGHNVALTEVPVKVETRIGALVR